MARRMRKGGIGHGRPINRVNDNGGGASYQNIAGCIRFCNMASQGQGGVPYGGCMKGCTDDILHGFSWF